MAFNTDWLDDVHSSIVNDKITEKIQDKAKWPIFVYDWINKTPNTEAGLKEANEPRTQHYQWSEIIKGNESVYLSPMNATTLTKHQGTGKLIPGTDRVDGSYYEVNYSKDDSVVFYGIKISANGGNTFGSTTFGGFGDFTTISDQETIQMKTTQKVSKDLLTKFFYIPDVAQIVENRNKGQFDQSFNDNDIFYISSYTNYFNENNGDFLYSEITFENLQQNMAQSGQIIEQHVYLASPGAGYLIPKLLFNENGTPIGSTDGWEWNTNFTQDKGVKTIQIEVQGNYAFCSLEIWGYPVDPDHNDLGNKRWYAPRKLLVEEFRLPLDENFYKVSPNNAEFVIADGKLTATTDLKAYKTMIHNFAGDTPLTYQGIISTTKEPTHNTNATGYTINDTQFGFDDKYLDSLKQEDGKTANTDFNKFYTTDSQWFYDGQKENGTDGIGQKTIDLHRVHKTANGNHSASQLMNLMSFALQPINRLPFEINSKLTWSTLDFSGFGGFVNKALFGMSPTWRTITNSTNVLMPKLQTIPMFMNKDFYDLSTNSVYESNMLNKNNTYFAWDLSQIGSGTYQENVGKVPMDFFQQKESDVLGAVLSNKSNSTTLTFTLTDKLWASQYNDDDSKEQDLKNISSVLLNQNVDGKRFKVDETSFSSPSKSKDNEVLTDINGQSYIITNIGFKGLGDGDVRITCFDKDIDEIQSNEDYHEHINFQTYMKTTASYKNGSIREWLTNLNTSYLDFLDKYLEEKFTWPNAMPIPQPEYYLPDINYTQDNISDYALYANIKPWVSPGKSVNMDYFDNETKDDYNYLTGYLINILDLSRRGINTIDDVLKNYEKLIVSSPNLHFIRSGIVNDWYHTGGPHDPYLSIMSPNAKGLGNSANKDWMIDEIHSINLTINTNDLPVWDESSKVDISYAYNVGTNYAGDISMGQFGKKNPTTSIKDANGIKSDWYYFPYLFKNSSNLELKMCIFYKGNMTTMFYGNSDYSDPESTTATAMFYIGGKTIFDDESNNIYWPNPQDILPDEGLYTIELANGKDRLFNHKGYTFSISSTLVSYKLGKNKN